MNKSDANANEIVSVLRQAGCSVVFIAGQFAAGVPDILVSRKGQTWLMEIKAKGGRLSESQKTFIAAWQATIAVVHSSDEALAAIGLTSRATS